MPFFIGCLSYTKFLSLEVSLLLGVSEVVLKGQFGTTYHCLFCLTSLCPQPVPFIMVDG